MNRLTASHLVEVPSSTAPGLEGLVGRANERRLAAAVRRLDACIPGLFAAIELSSRRGMEAASAGVLRLEKPLDQERIYGCLDRTLRNDDSKPGRLIIGTPKHNSSLDASLDFDATWGQYRPHIGQLADKLVQGACVFVHAVGMLPASIVQLLTDIEVVIGARFEAGIALLGPGSVLPRMRQLGGATLVIAVDGHLKVRERDARGDCRCLNVRPGEALLAVDGSSLEVTSDTLSLAIALCCPGVARGELWKDALSVARYHPHLRADLPADLSGVITSAAGNSLFAGNALYEHARAVIDSEGSDYVTASLRASVPGRCREKFTDLWFHRGEERTFRSPLVGGVLLTRVGDDQALAAAGLVVVLDPIYWEALVPRLDGNLFDASELIGMKEGDPTEGGTSRSSLTLGTFAALGHSRVESALGTLLAIGYLEPFHGR